MRAWSSELLESGDTAGSARARCLRLSQLTGRSADKSVAIWQWGFLQRVSNGLLCLKNPALADEGRKMLAVADACSAGDAVHF